VPLNYRFTGIGDASAGLYYFHMQVQEHTFALFQPIVDAHTHCVVGCALVCAQSCFTPTAQDSPNEMALQDWRDALTCLQTWRALSHKLSLLAQVSEQQLRTPTFMAQLKRWLEQLQIPASCIELGISERVAMNDADFMIGCLTALRQSGFSIVIDKLGSGYSTVSQWLDTPSTGIRIDEALTRRAQARTGAALIEVILKLASFHGLRTIAAGVQDADAAAVLSLLGVHRLQGNYFGQPMDCQSFTHRLSGQSHAN
jgi:EAL domain-containing protein (putative c-di-GMP-specific phosphodiesterase class I)